MLECYGNTEQRRQIEKDRFINRFLKGKPTMDDSLFDQFEKKIKALDKNATFFDNSQFPWALKVEENWKEIRKELDQVISALEILPGFEEIQSEQRALTTDKRWKIFPLVVYEHDIKENQLRCPLTTKALKHIPDLQVAMFSIFQGGKELAPHRGPYAGVLRYHLGLKVPHPELCGITVGNDTRSWEEGKSLIFDDSHDHYAWNRSDEDRVVLFVDFLRPLPDHLRETNREIQTEIRESDFSLSMMRNWAKWESIHGKNLDKIILNKIQ